MMTLPPFVWFFVAALFAVVLRGPARAAVMLAAPVFSGWKLWQMGVGTTWAIPFLDYELVPLRVDELSLMFGYLFHIAAFLAILFALRVKDTVQHVGALLYVGSALGALFAGDLITLFVFWEIMAVSSVFLIWASRNENALRSGFRYLVIQVLSGVLLLSGALVIAQESGSVAFDEIGLNGLAGWLIFAAFAIKCVFPLLHNWVTDAYPQATPTGAVFLCIFTTKTAVYALARGYPGTELLIYIGAVMVLFPVFYAMIENDLRRVLAYSMINQIGFMVCAIGIGSSLALNGMAATAFNHVIYEGLLFMALGAVLYRTGTARASDLARVPGGLYQSMPLTALSCVIGAAAMCAVPLFSGFVSKSLIMSAVLEEGMYGLWLLLMLGAAAVVACVGIKVPYYAFFAGGRKPVPEDNVPDDKGETPLHMVIAMALAAGLCIAIGVAPGLLYGILPYEMSYWPYDTSHVLAQLQLVCFVGLVFMGLAYKGWLPALKPSRFLDFEWFYRRAFPWLVRLLGKIYTLVNDVIRGRIVRGVSAVIGGLVRHHGVGRELERAWPIGSMVLWVAILLGFYLIFYYS